MAYADAGCNLASMEVAPSELPVSQMRSRSVKTFLVIGALAAYSIVSLSIVTSDPKLASLDFLPGTIRLMLGMVLGYGGVLAGIVALWWTPLAIDSLVQILSPPAYLFPVRASIVTIAWAAPIVWFADTAAGWNNFFSSWAPDTSVESAFYNLIWLALCFVGGFILCFFRTDLGTLHPPLIAVFAATFLSYLLPQSSPFQFQWYVFESLAMGAGILYSLWHDKLAMAFYRWCLRKQ
jgi:hypothetical protein